MTPERGARVHENRAWTAGARRQDSWSVEAWLLMRGGLLLMSKRGGLLVTRGGLLLMSKRGGLLVTRGGLLH